MNIEKNYGRKVKCEYCKEEIVLDEFNTEQVGTNTIVVYCEHGCEFVLDAENK